MPHMIAAELIAISSLIFLRVIADAIAIDIDAAS